MEYKTYNCHSFNVHTIKTDKFKTCHMEIIFRKIGEQKDYAYYSMLSDFLTDSSKKYPTRKDVVTQSEELYRALFYGVTSKVGQVLMNNFVYDFISPKYIEDENYLEEVLQFPFEMIQNPNAINEEFDLNYFNIIKNRLENDIKSLKEDSIRYCINESLKVMDNTSPSSFVATGTLEDLESITPSTLYQEYKKMLKYMACDIFIIGSLDMDKVVSLIQKYFHKRTINNEKITFTVENKIRKKVLKKEENSTFSLANLSVIFNIENMNQFERDIVFYVFNHIYGNGGLTSKLYKEVREKHSLCYAIDSIYLKNDNLLLIHVSLDNKNVNKCVKLIEKELKSIKLGNIKDEEVEDAINSIEANHMLSLDNAVAIINNYAFHKFINLPLLEDRLSLYKKVTKNDIFKLAKKIKINTVYVLKGENACEGN